MNPGTGTFVAQAEALVGMRVVVREIRDLFLLAVHLPPVSVHTGVLRVPSAFRLSTMRGSAAKQGRVLIVVIVTRVKNLIGVFIFWKIDETLVYLEVA